MRFFKKARQSAGSLIIAFHADGIRAATLRRVPNGKPSVELAAFYPSTLAQAPEMLEKLKRELQTQNYHCCTMLGAAEYQMMAVDAPNVPADEMRTAARWRLKDMLDFPVDTATIDVLDIPVDNSAPGRSHTMFVVAARNSVIEQRQNLFVAAQIGLAVIDIPEMAQRNMSALLEPPGRGLAMLSFGPDGGLLTITFNAELYLTRRIDVTLTQLLEPDYDKKHASFDKITLELQRSLDHFDRQFHFINVSKLLLAPSGASGLEEYLSSNLYTPVESFSLADVLDLDKAPDLHELTQQQSFFLTLGAALRLEGSAP